MTIVKLAVVIFILLVGLALRLHNYEIYPQRGASSDEYTYTFLGLSLLTKHYPESWSNFSLYKNKYDLTIRNLYFPMVYPYFDHPPLNGLLVGGWSLAWGQDTYEKVDLKTIRLVPIFLSIISSILVFLIAYRLYNYTTAIWALLIYVTTTIFVMNTRVVFAENLVTPIFLLALYLYNKFAKRITAGQATLLGVLAGSAVLAKELGIVVFLTLTFFFISEKVKRSRLIIFILSFLIVAFLYVIYGFYFDKNLFLQVVTHQASRQVGPEVLFMLTQTPIIVNKIYYDGWYFLGWLALFFILFDVTQSRRIIVPAFTYFLLLMISLTKEGEMGWYMIPMFPFMAIASARLLNNNLDKKGWFIFTLLTFVGLPQIKLLYEDNFGLTTSVFRVLILIMFGPLILALLFRRETVFTRFTRLWFYLLILGNIILTYHYIHPA